MMSEVEKNSELETNTTVIDSVENHPETESSTPEIVENSDSELNQKQEETSSVDEEREISAEQDNIAEDDSQAKISALEAQITSLQNQLQAEQEQGQITKSQYMRLNADFENFRRRTEKEQEELEIRGKKKAILELLTVVDNFERARNQLKPSTDGEMVIHKSYQGVYKTFVESLKKMGVSAMRPEGEPFDPNYHEAMLREPTNEYPEGTVIEQLVRGYFFIVKKEKEEVKEVLRHAMVKVATEAEEDLTNNDDVVAQGEE
jgi:molecular chaperone GrpE